MTDHDNKDFEDQKLSALYKKASNEEPPAHLDDEIMALAHRETEKHKHPVSPFSGKWQISASMAAILVIAFGLITFIDMEVPEEIDGIPASVTPRVQLDESIPASKPSPAVIEGGATPEAQSSQASRFSSIKAPATEETEMALAMPEKKATEKRKAKEQTTIAELKQVPEKLAKARSSKEESVPTQSIATPMALSAPPVDREKTPARMAKSPPAEPTVAPSATARAFNDLASSITQAYTEDDIDDRSDFKKDIATSSGIAGRSQIISSQKMVNSCGSGFNAIDIERYWHHATYNSITSSNKKSDLMCIDVMEGEELKRYFISLATLEDRTAKEHAYINIIRKAIETVSFTALRDETIESHYNTLRKITDETFTDAEQWWEWFETNIESLKLNDSGDKIVIK